jgi:HAD superfamily hydrolase (TIGR01549 family)
MRYTALVFDFDGPLFDGRAAASRALAATAEKFEERLAPQRFSLDHLPLLPPRALIALRYSEADLPSEQLQEIEVFYRERLAKAEDDIDVNLEIKRMLRQLHDSGTKVAILSSRRKESLMRRLRAGSIDKLVSVVHGRDSLPNPKPHPDALVQTARDLGVATTDLVFIGDSDADYECARDAKVPYYHILWSGEPSHGARAGAAAVFQTPADLREALGQPTSGVAELDSHRLPEDLEEAIENHHLCLYAGAGVSVPSGIGDWQGHYRNVFQKLEASYLMDAKFELPELLQLLAAQPELAKRVFDRFRESFDRPDVDPNPYHYALLRAQAERIWTSNYDQLFEKANATGGFGYTPVTNDHALLEHFRSRRLVVKMNGDFSAATYADSLDWDLVFTQEQFDLVERQRPEIWRLFEDDYRNRCLLFVGVSFRDAALRRIAAVARQKIPRTRYNHFLLARRASDPVQRRQEDLQAANLRRQSIQTVFFSDFEAIERFVADVVVAHRCPIIGFGGSFRGLENASEEELQASTSTLAGGSTNPSQVAAFGAALGKALAERGYRVTSGCSPVVGIPPVSAAFEAMPLRARFYLRTGGGTKYASTAPAIVVASGSDPNHDVYEPMRKRFISELSLLIAYGSTERADGRTPGAILEIEMAMSKQIPVLIVPQVGGAVAEYREKFLQGIDRAYPDPMLAKEIRALNLRIGDLPAAELTSFARSDLPEAIHELMRRLARCSLQVGRREAISTDW